MKKGTGGTQDFGGQKTRHTGSGPGQSDVPLDAKSIPGEKHTRATKVFDPADIEQILGSRR